MDIVGLMIGFLSLFMFIWDIPWELYLTSITKSVPLTLKEMWAYCKLSLQQIHIWECPTLVLNTKID